MIKIIILLTILFSLNAKADDDTSVYVYTGYHCILFDSNNKVINPYVEQVKISEYIILAKVKDKSGYYTKLYAPYYRCKEIK